MNLEIFSKDFPSFEGFYKDFQIFFLLAKFLQWLSAPLTTKNYKKKFIRE